MRRLNSTIILTLLSLFAINKSNNFIDEQKISNAFENDYGLTGGGSHYYGHLYNDENTDALIKNQGCNFSVNNGAFYYTIDTITIDNKTYTPYINGVNAKLNKIQYDKNNDDVKIEYRYYPYKYSSLPNNVYNSLISYSTSTYTFDKNIPYGPTSGYDGTLYQYNISPSFWTDSKSFTAHYDVTKYTSLSKEGRGELFWGYDETTINDWRYNYTNSDAKVDATNYVKNNFYQKYEYTLKLSPYFSSDMFKVASLKNKISKNNLYSWYQVKYEGLNKEGNGVEEKRYAFSTKEKAEEEVISSYYNLAIKNEAYNANLSTKNDSTGNKIYYFNNVISYPMNSTYYSNVIIYNNDNKFKDASLFKTYFFYIIKLPGNDFYSAFLKDWGEDYLKEVITKKVKNKVEFYKASFFTSLKNRYDEFTKDDVYDNYNDYGNEITFPQAYNVFSFNQKYYDIDNNKVVNNTSIYNASSDIDKAGYYQIDVNSTTRKNIYLYNDSAKFQLHSDDISLDNKLSTTTIKTVFDTLKEDEVKSISFSYFDACQINVYKLVETIDEDDRVIKENKLIDTLYNKIDLSSSNISLEKAIYQIKEQGIYTFKLYDRLSNVDTWTINVSSQKSAIKVNKADNSTLSFEINTSDGQLNNIESLYIYQKKVAKDNFNTIQYSIYDDINRVNDKDEDGNSLYSLIYDYDNDKYKDHEFTFKPIIKDEKKYYLSLNIVILDKYGQSTIQTIDWNFVNNLEKINSDSIASSLENNILFIDDEITLPSSLKCSISNDTAIIDRTKLKIKKEGDFSLFIEDDIGNYKEIKYKTISPLKAYLIIDEENEEIIDNKIKETESSFKLLVSENTEITINDSPYVDEEISKPGTYNIVIKRTTSFEGLSKEEIINYQVIIKEKKEDKTNNDVSNKPKDDGIINDTQNNLVTTKNKINSLYYIIPCASVGVIILITSTFLIVRKIKKDKSMK